VTLRVLIADDHPMFREGLAAMLEAQTDMTVVACVGTGHAAQEAAQVCLPDIAVLDLRMPDGDGVSTAAAIRRTNPSTRILVLTSFDATDDVTAALTAGAHGYLTKSSAPDEIAQAVRAVATGTAVLANDVLAGLARTASNSARRVFPELTDRETSVLTALAAGLSTDAAASRLGLTPKTIRNHVAAITAKLGVRDRAAAVLEARRRGSPHPEEGREPPRNHG
jgi:DNA-binding NarL/FixJ family response regulator